MLNLKLTRLGNPILRQPTRNLSPGDILSEPIQNLIQKMKTMVEGNEYGVGISANQIGESVRVSVVAIKSTPTRPNRIRFQCVMINPEIVETFGRRPALWEACLSCGAGKNIIYGLVPRYKKVRVKYLDEDATAREATLTNLAAHVIQHEIDHLNGVFFFDKVQRKSLMMADEYRLRIVGTARANYYDKEKKGQS